MEQSKSRNLLERLRDLEEDASRFMIDVYVSFTDDFGEKRYPDDQDSTEDLGMFSINGWRPDFLPHPWLFVNVSQAGS